MTTCVCALVCSSLGFHHDNLDDVFFMMFMFCLVSKSCVFRLLSVFNVPRLQKTIVRQKLCRLHPRGGVSGTLKDI